LIRVHDRRYCIVVSYHVIALGHIVLLGDVDELVKREVAVGDRGVVTAWNVEDACAETKASRVDFGQAGSTRGVLLHIEAKHPRDVRIDRLDGGGAHLDHLWRKNRLRERRERGEPRWMGAASEVGQ